MIPVTDEEAAEVGVFKYVLSQSVREQLIEQLQDWPGIHCVASLQEDIEAEAAAVSLETGAQVLGVEAILSRDPLYRPEKLARPPAPLVHAATQAAGKAFYEAYSWFLGAFRDAAEKLRRRDRVAASPLPAVPASAALRSWIGRPGRDL
ncbi:MAG: hypothetical protein QOF89_6094 [Acidobacteriota bacterium]|jgi:hypothetical protein|nr:hypothetical protein [Acidobacteriota bacterium]